MRSLNKTAICIVFVLAILSALPILLALEIKSVEISPYEIAPGDTATISLKIKNTFNEDIDDVNVMLDFSSENIPIAPYQGSSESGIDELSEGDSENFIFNIIVFPEASSGIYKIPVRIAYEKNGILKEKTNTIGVIVNSPAKLNIIANGVLIKGIEREIMLKIINDGLSDIKFLSIQIQQPTNGKILSPLYEYLGNLDSDDFDSIDVKIFTDIDSSETLYLPLKVTYKDSTNKDFSENKLLQIKVYSLEEAKKLGMIDGKSRIIYFIFGAILLIFIIYRIRKSFSK